MGCAQRSAVLRQSLADVRYAHSGCRPLHLARRANQFWLSEIMSSPGIKNISLYQKGKSVVHSWPSRPTQRGVGHRHNEGRVAVDVAVALDARNRGVR